MSYKLQQRSASLLLSISALLCAACNTEVPQVVPPTATTALTTAESAPVEAISKEEVNLLDYADQRKGEDWSSALTAALKDANSVYIPAGRYPCSAVNIPSEKMIRGDGAQTVLVQKKSRLFNLQGSARELGALTADMADFSDRFMLAQAAELEAGDLIYLLGQRNVTILDDCGYDWCLGRSYHAGTTCFFGEFLTVAGVEGETVITETNTIFPYYYADGSRESDPLPPTTEVRDYPYRREATTVSLIKPVSNVTLADMTLETSSGTAVAAKWARDCVFRNLSFVSPAGSVPEKDLMFVWLSEGLDCQMQDCTFSILTPPDSAELQTASDYSSYNIARIVSSYRCGFIRCTSDFSTHAFNIGKGNKRGTSYGCYVQDCTASNAVWSGIYVSAGCYMTDLSGNTITSSAQGITIAGRRNTITGNHIDLGLPATSAYYYVRPAEGGTAGIALIEGYALDTQITANTISRAYTAILMRDGYESTNIFERGNITVRDNTVTDCVQGFFNYKSSANTGACLLDLTIAGNRFSGGSAENGYAGKFGVRISPRTLRVTIAENQIEGFTTQINVSPSVENQISITP